jgi:hypothetical protein
MRSRRLSLVLTCLFLYGAAPLFAQTSAPPNAAPAAEGSSPPTTIAPAAPGSSGANGDDDDPSATEFQTSDFKEDSKDSKDAPQVVPPQLQTAPSQSPVQPGETTSTPRQPLVAPPVTYLDLNTARFGRLEIDLRDAEFLKASVPQLKLLAENMDFNSGTLDSLKIDIVGAKFLEFTVDSLTLFTKGNVHFETGSLLNKRVLEFLSPVTAFVHVSISEKGLNQFLNSPRTLHRLSYSAKRRVPILSTLAGRDVRFGFEFTDADIAIRPENMVRLDLDSKLGMGGVGVGVPVTVDTKLGLQDGWLKLSDTIVKTKSKELPPEVAERIVRRVNSLSEWGHKSDDIHFTFTDLRVIPGDKLELKGTAEINRLRFGRIQDVQSQLSNPETSTGSEVGATSEDKKDGKEPSLRDKKKKKKEKKRKKAS